MAVPEWRPQEPSQLDSAEVTAQQTMQEQIDLAVALWADGDIEPSFSMEHLAIMALAYAGRPRSKDEVLRWIIQHVRYYRELIYQEPPSWRKEEHEAHEHQVMRFRHGLRTVFNTVEMPFRTFGVGREMDYTFSLPAATLPQSVLPRQDTFEQAFPFFRLPAELRSDIYAMVFQYPQTGIEHSTEYYAPSPYFEFSPEATPEDAGGYRLE